MTPPNGDGPRDREAMNTPTLHDILDPDFMAIAQHAGEDCVLEAVEYGNHMVLGRLFPDEVAIECTTHNEVVVRRTQKGY